MPSFFGRPVAAAAAAYQPFAPNIVTSPSQTVVEGGLYVATFTAVGEPEILWSLGAEADAAYFSIDPATGELFTSEALDYESPDDADANNVYQFTITATNPIGAHSINASVAVFDADEGTAPTITSGSNYSVAEGSTTVGTMTADGDAPIAWSIDEVGDEAFFSIGSSSGVLSFLAAPDYETPQDANGDNEYSIVIRASNATGAVTRALSITVTNVAEGTAPTITSSDTYSVAENTSANFATMTATGTGPITWSKAAGNDAAKFTINSSTGALKFTAAPDYENPQDTDTNNVYLVTVVATNALGSDDLLVSVTVTDVADTGVPVITSDSAYSIDENTSDVATMTATGTAPITWSLQASGDHALFTINSSTGALQFISAPDYETPLDAGGNNVYDVTVVATNSGGSDTQAVAITVLNVSESGGSELSGDLYLIPTYNEIAVFGRNIVAPSGANGDDDAEVQFRTPPDSGSWQNAMYSWYDRRPLQDSNGNQYGGKEYRSSVFMLKPNTSYRVRLRPKGQTNWISATTTTWKDPDLGQITGTTTTDSSDPSGTPITDDGAKVGMVLSQSGTANNWKIYDFTGKVIDGNNFSSPLADGLVIRGSYIWVKGLEVKNVGRHCIRIGDQDFNNLDLHDIIIDGCNLHRWGSVASGEYVGFGRNLDSALWSRSSKLRRVTFQRNEVHDPNYSSNAWSEPGKWARKHPKGPQVITFDRSRQNDVDQGFCTGTNPNTGMVIKNNFYSAMVGGTLAGNHVIRYNNIWGQTERVAIGSLSTKRFNDIFGSYSTNYGNSGFGIHSTSIYGNYIEGSWDDINEWDGGGRNNRFFGNFCDIFFGGSSHQGLLGGPTYYFANAYRASNHGKANTHESGRGIKTSGLVPDTGPTHDCRGGRAYHLNEVVLDVDEGNLRGIGIFLGDGWKGSTERSIYSKVVNARVYNMIVRSDSRNDFGSVFGFAMGQSDGDLTVKNRIDYCLVSAWKAPNATGTKGVTDSDAANAHGWKNTNSGNNTYNATFDALELPDRPVVGSGLLTGRYRLHSSSLGYHGGIAIPQITPASNVDIGPGTKQLEYGPLAYLNPTGEWNP